MLTPDDLALIQTMIQGAPTVGEGFPQPIVAGQNLLIPGIQSPNFSSVTQTGWQILKSGLATFFGLTVTGGTISGPDYIFNANGLFFYDGTPATGNLVGWLTPVSGTDGFGNTYFAGLNTGGFGNSYVATVPHLNAPFDITTTIAGLMQTIVSLSTGNANEVFAGFIGALTLGSGTTAKNGLVMASPADSGYGNQLAAVVLETQNVGGTDTPVITFGTTTSPDASTFIFSPILTITPYALLLYGGVGGQTVVTKTSGSGTIPIPVGVSTVKGEVVGGGGGGTGGPNPSLTQAGGGAAGEYSAEASLAVTGGGTVSYVVGAAGTGGSNAGGVAGGTSTLTGSAITVTGHGGAGGPAPGNTSGLGTRAAGGTGSTNTTHFDGGRGGAGWGQGLSGSQGGGGGGSGGMASAGNSGHDAAAGVPGAGAAAVTGGGPGGNGTSSTTPGGTPSTAPGGGGGGSPAGAGGAGKAGQVRITYSTSVPTILASIATVGGTDQFGTSYPNGTVLPILVSGVQWGASVSSLDAGSTISLANVSLPASINAGPRIYGATGHGGEVAASGLQRNYSGGQLADTTTRSATGISGTTVSGTFTIPAADAVAGAVYKVHVFGNGTQGTTAQNLTFQGFLGGVATGSAQTVSTTANPISQAFRWHATLTAVVVTTGAGGTAFFALEVTFANAATTPATANCITFMEMNSTTMAFNTTIANTVILQAFWASATGSPTMAGQFSYMERIA